MPWWIIGAGIYLCGYAICFAFPSLLHKRKKSLLLEKLINGKVKIIAHRGGLEYFPENSLSAFEKSDQMGCFGIELDVHLTKDDKLVVLHDKNYERVNGQNNLPSDLHYYQVKNYLTKIWDDNAMSYFNYDKSFSEKPPLLEDIILRLPKDSTTCINIEIKSGSPKELKMVVDLVHKYKFEDKVIIGFAHSNNSKDIINSMKKKVLTFSPKNELLLFILGSMFLFLPFVSFKNDCISITGYFESTIKSKDVKKSIFLQILLMITNIISPIYPLLIWHMNRRGIPVVFWTLNTENDWNKAIKMGANGIMTDFPEKLIKKTTIC